MLRQKRLWLVLLSIVSAMLIVLLFMRIHAQGLRWVEATRMCLISLFYAGVVGWSVTAKGDSITSLLSTGPLRFIGKVSYGLYVYHPAVFAFLMPRFGPTSRMLQLAISLAAAFGVACLSWYGFERFFIRLKEKIAPESRPLPLQGFQFVAHESRTEVKPSI
jgi:peptidoglycan/LPS O-acetylase OafA/YrhL